jgi:hypothetical protein
MRAASSRLSPIRSPRRCGPIREALAKVDPKPTPAPLPPRKPYVLSLVLAKKNKRRR